MPRRRDVNLNLLTSNLVSCLCASIRPRCVVHGEQCVVYGLLSDTGHADMQLPLSFGHNNYKNTKKRYFVYITVQIHRERSLLGT